MTFAWCERLVVLYTNQSLSPQEIVKRLNESDIAKLWIPNASDFIFVEELPILTTGKLDLQRLKKLAQSRFALV
jgi:acyl-[acyl-carrier-protein]-phospholipid O-acyltransferase/long-chain-fatty-acid--[acyl-carrier-protein] ligase